MKRKAFPFDTLDVKPKLYSIVVVTVLFALLIPALLPLAEHTRIPWGCTALAVYFGAVTLLLQNALKRQIRYNPYSYNTIIYSGFSVFCLTMAVMFVLTAARAFTDPASVTERQMLLLLVDSGKGYIYRTSPFLVGFAAALTVSNISLIRHEGRRFVNMLGILLGILLAAGIGVILLLDRWAALREGSRLTAMLLINLAAAGYLYFECMILGAIAADAMAAAYEPAPDKEYLIVLGCGIRRDGTPTPLLRGRLDLAADFWRNQAEKTGRRAIIVCSGGQGPDEVCSEARCMADYLLSRGIPSEYVLLEDRSSDTAENMRFTRDLIGAARGQGHIAFFTTNYHVFRAGLKARRVKMRAVGMGAKTRWYFWPNAAVREFVGLLTEHRVKQACILLGLALVYTVLTVLAYR